jgi:hypothetical protein
MQPHGLRGWELWVAGELCKSGLTSDHSLSRLQRKLQKSGETGVELYDVTGAMNGIHGTLGGSLVSFVFMIMIKYPN